MNPIYELSGTTSLIRQAQAQGLDIAEVPTNLPIGPIQEGIHKTLALTPTFGLERPLIGYHSESGVLLADARIVQSLNRVDATDRAQRHIDIAHFQPGVRAQIDPRLWVEFLLRTELITTYWHIGATLERVGEDMNGGSYRAHLVGTHTYFTQERNEESLDFYVLVEGAITRLSLEGT